FDKRSSSLVRALPSGRVLLHAHQQYRLTRSDSLTPTLPFPAHGYRKCLLGRISPAGRRGSLQLTRCRSHHVAADTPPVRTAASDSFRRPLLPSRVIDRLGHRVENVYRGYVCVHCTLQPDASRTLLSSMLSEGSAVLLSHHGASLASKPESFGFGRTFTDMTACPLTGHADYPTRPVHVIVGYPPGSGPDIEGRLIAQWLSERLGQPFVVENRPGAASNIATEAV